MEKMWYYSRGKSDQQGPVSDADLQVMLRTGTLRARDFVWTEGMGPWTAAGSLPELAAYLPGPSLPTAAATSGVAPPGLGGWMLILGLLLIVGGVAACLTVVGILHGALMIGAGTGLLGARSALPRIAATDPAVTEFLGKLNRFVVLAVMAGLLSGVAAIALWIIFFVIAFG
jgi:hypothetical protein